MPLSRRPNDRRMTKKGRIADDRAGNRACDPSLLRRLKKRGRRGIAVPCRRLTGGLEVLYPPEQRPRPLQSYLWVS
jgi:hypothetical protein